MNQLTCPTCSAPINASDIDHIDHIGVCATCGTEFYLDTLGNPHIQRIGEHDKGKRKRKPAKPPPGMTSTLEDDQLVIQYRKFDGCTILFMLVWSGFWNVVTWGIFLGTLFVNITSFSIIKFFITLFLIPFLVIGVGSAYYLLQLMFNKTLIIANQDFVKVAHVPLPWFGAKTVPIEDLRKLRVTRGDATTSKPNGEVDRYYDLKYVTASGEEKLVDLPGAELSSFVQIELADYLGLPERDVLPMTDETDDNVPRQPKQLIYETPKGVTVSTEKGWLEIRYRWFQWLPFIGISIFAGFWNSILWTIVVSELASGDMDGGIIFLTPFLLVGIGLLYYVISQLGNSTIIKVDYEQLTLQHHPFPWFGEKTIAVDDISQLYVRKEISTDSDGDTTTSYHLQMIVAESSTDKKLMTVTSPDIGQFIEQEVERYLQIQDEPVPDEFREQK